MNVTKDNQISLILLLITTCIVIAGIYSIYCVSDITHVRAAEHSFRMVRMVYGQHTIIA
jgi:hypothetical protein